MYEASDLFKKAISQTNRDLRIRVTIEGKVYTDTEIQECSIEESILNGEEFKFGSSTASRLDLTLLNMDESLTAKSFEKKSVHIEIGVMLDKFSQPFEYISMGYFIVEEASKDNGLIKMSGYDKMIYFEKSYESNLTYPATLLQILQEVCSIANVPLKNTSFLNHDYMISEMPNFENATLRMVAEYISEVACGFASINRNSELEILTFTNTNTIINADNYYSMNLSEYEYGPIEQIEINPENIFGNEQLKANMLNAIQGFTFKPFTCSWQGNPLTAPGDVIQVSYKNGDTYKSFIANQKFTFSTGLTCDIATNTKTAIQTEYKSSGPITKELAKAKSRIEQTESEITLAVERIDEAEAQLIIQADQISLKVEKNGVISAINQTAEAITIEASKLNLTGYATFTSLSTPGATIIDGGNIQTGNFSADRIRGGVLRLLAGTSGNTANIYADEAEYATGNLIFSAGRYTFEAGGTVDFANNPVTGLNLTVVFG
jgi:hypothetical protein